MTDQEYILNPLDALGNPIVIGGTYGYTQSTSGISTANVGTVRRITPKGMVSLSVTMKRKGVWNCVPDVVTIGAKPISATVKAIHLFPIG